MTREEFLVKYAELAKGYKPSRRALKSIEKVKLLIIIGPTGVGKTTLINQLDIPFVPSDTTRAPRPGEVDGRDMLFLSDYALAAKDVADGKFLQVAIGVSGDLYATRASSYPGSGWATMPVITDVVPVFRSLGFAKTLSVFICPPNYGEWMRRLGAHHVDANVLAKRMAEAKRSLEFSLSDDDIHFVLNDEVEPAVDQIKKLLAGVADAEREKAARAAAEECLDELKKQINL